VALPETQDDSQMLLITYVDGPFLTEWDKVSETYHKRTSISTSSNGTPEGPCDHVSVQKGSVSIRRHP
jgi:hypothetical protein